MRVFMIFLFPILLFSSSIINLPYSGFEVEHTLLDGSRKKVFIQKSQPKECIDIAMSSQNFWSGDFASKNIDQKCKKEFITTKGIIQPINFNENIKTLGELEVLEFIKYKSSQDSDKYILVDSRPLSWYEDITIPTAFSIPYDELEADEMFMDEYLLNLQKLGLKELQNGTFDFTNAKTMVLFCNGIWCVQSSRAMQKLIDIGYPQDKIMWYRGCISSWLSVGLPVINNKNGKIR